MSNTTFTYVTYLMTVLVVIGCSLAINYIRKNERRVTGFAKLCVLVWAISVTGLAVQTPGVWTRLTSERTVEIVTATDVTKINGFYFSFVAKELGRTIVSRTPVGEGERVKLSVYRNGSGDILIVDH
jgi:hypothetical protein